MWNAKSGNVLFTLKGHTDGVRAVAFSQDGARIANGSGYFTTRDWDTQTGKSGSPSAGTDGVWAVAFSPDGSRIVTGSWDNTVKV